MEARKDEQPVIACDELVKIYQTDSTKVMALQGLDLAVGKGEMMAIIGKSGSGKSTLLNMIGGLETPTAGRLLIAGRDLSAFSEKALVRYRRKIVGFVWQKSARNLFFYMTVLENVEAPMLFEKSAKKERKARALSLLAEVGMESYAERFPAQLSGGQQQRVAIAVALANEPSILLADEPTGSVDSRTADEIFRLFEKLNRTRGLTILIVTHDPALADKVGRVVRISDGKVSTEKTRLSSLTGAWTADGEHEEYAVLDKAHRLQLGEDMLEGAGITGNRVKVGLEQGKIVISK